MDKKIFIIGFAFILVMAGLVFVMAAVTVDNILFENNVTSLYDEGHFTINWTVGTDAAANYSIYLWMNDNYATTIANTTLNNYTFTNNTEANYTFTVGVRNGTAVETNSTNVSMYVDSTAPVVTLQQYTNATLKRNTDTLDLNISVVDAGSGGSVCLVDVNGSGSSNQSIAVSSGWCNFTATNVLSLTGSTDGNHTIRVYVNDTVNNLGLNNSFVVQIDTTAPSLVLSSSSATITSLTISIAGVEEGTCTVNRSGASITDSTLTETGLSCGSSYAYVVTCTDAAGNAGSSSSTSFSTIGCGGGSPSTSPGTVTKKETYSWTKIIPGEVIIMKDFDEEIGLKQIQIEVNNEAQNVRVTVAKYNGKPADVSVEKSGKVYEYLHINAENLEVKLERAIIRMQVEKSWMTTNGFEINDIAMFKFNENNNAWDELGTAYVEEDADYYFYDTEVDSFSYFAISEKVSVEGNEPIAEKIGLWWIAIILGVIIIGIIISIIFAKKKKR